jgi:hypothetical protein
MWIKGQAYTVNLHLMFLQQAVALSLQLQETSIN